MLRTALVDPGISPASAKELCRRWLQAATEPDGVGEWARQFRDQSNGTFQIKFVGA